MVFCYQNCSDLLWEKLFYCLRKTFVIQGWRPRICKSFSRSLEEFFLTVGQNNFGNKIPFLWFQVVILDYPSIICPGKQFVLHLQAIIEEVTLKAIICLVDKKTGEKQPRARFIKQDQHAIVRFQSEDIICMETFKDHPQLGRFTLRDEGKISWYFPSFYFTDL